MKFFPPKITTADRLPLVLDDGEVVFDTDEKILYIGDGVTVGGNPPSSSTVFSSDEIDAIQDANLPSSTNPFATMDDILPSSGDMLKSTYDTDNDGIVDAAEQLDNGTNIATVAEIRNAIDTDIPDLQTNKYNASNPSGFISTILGITAGGELSGTYPNPAILNSAILAKVLTGLNVTGSSLVATDNLLEAFGKLQNQINGVLGGAIYQSTWSASSNTPTLANGVGTKGYYYVASSNGIVNFGAGNIDFNTGDWAIYNGTIWEKVDNTDAVSSVNGYIGTVNLTTANITEVTNLYFTTARVLATVLTGYTSGAGTVSTTDTILQAIQKLNGNIDGLTTANVASSTNKRYLTDAQLVVVGNTSNTNTGDETGTTIKTKLGVTNVSNIIDQQGAGSAVGASNNSTAVDVYSLVVAANTLVSGKSMRIKCFLTHLNNSGSSNTHTIALTLAGTVIATRPISVLNRTVDYNYILEFEMYNDAGNLKIRGKYDNWFNAGATTGIGGALNTQQFYSPTDAAFNAANSNTFAITALNSISNANTSTTRIFGKTIIE